ncbi:hypothetical protein [Knoellia koreensis]|uniref:Uncharacterized protein n=1 Tax=Knoellia koreensis TaxID=2730921 RepID=A0A849HH67_9MICO|nr:hypothetical protein [Knoellia sp. DB2414S]NNM46549.1 hypothetical protein [Knoellia sp. DB2414S]
MTQWQYFLITYGPEVDVPSVSFGRRDPAGPQYNCQTLDRAGEWVDSEKLSRYYLLGSNEDYLTDVDPDTAASLIREAHETGRFARLPDEPTRR